MACRTLNRIIQIIQFVMQRPFFRIQERFFCVSMSIRRVLCLPFLCLLMLWTTFAISAKSQLITKTDTTGVVEGKIVDDEGAPLRGVSLRVLTAKDSTLRTGTITDSLGVYRIKGLPTGSYVMNYSMIGFQAGYINFNLTPTRLSVTVPVVKMNTNDVILNAAVVTANIPPVTVIDDTVAYNADAYKAPEGAMVEDLIERIPGAEITDDGKIKINGKEYNRILVNGREFFGDDPQMALKNLPANIIKRIKTYDRHSAQARLTGIDDGVENNVIDLEIKPNLLKGLVGQISGATGSEERYSSAMNVNRFRRDQHFSIMGGMNNVNNPGFSERGRDAMNFSRGSRPGLTASKSVGMAYAKDKKDQYKISANIRYGYSNAENRSTSHSETVYNPTNYRFGDNNSHSVRRRNEFSADFRLEWRIDTLTNLHFSPRFSYYKTDNNSSGHNTTRKWNGDTAVDTTQLNERRSRNYSNSEGSDEGVSIGINRRLSRTGRSIGANASYNYSAGISNNYSRNVMQYFLQPNRNQNYNRYNDADNFNMNYSLGLSYSEPIYKGGYLQLRYSYSYRHSRANRYGYEINYDGIDSLLTDNERIDWATVPVDTSLSSCNANTYISHSINVNMRHTTSKLNVSYGVNLNPRHNETNYIFGPKMDKGLISQDLMNWSPSLNFRYRFTKRTNINLSYHGSSRDPNIDDLQEVIDKTNAQNIRYGNPALKPAFNNNMDIKFNHYGEKTNRSIVANFYYSTETNNVSNMTLSESSSGVRVSKLMNVDGRYSLGGNLNFNTPLDSARRFNISTNTQIDYNNSTNYNSTPLTTDDLLSVGITSDFQNLSPSDIDRLQPFALKNYTRTFRLRQSLGIRYRNNIFSTGINGSMSYYKVDNSIETANQRETFDYHLRTNFQVELPLNFQVSTAMTFTSRHGYSADIQKNIAIWNGQISFKFLKRNAGLITFQIYDLLHQRTTVDRRISNLTITDTWSEALRDYFMIGFQYRINTMGKGQGRNYNQMRENGQRNQKASQQSRSAASRSSGGSRPAGRSR